MLDKKGMGKRGLQEYGPRTKFGIFGGKERGEGTVVRRRDGEALRER